MKTENHKESSKRKMDKYIQYIYKITKVFPKNEIYGVVSQLRRAVLSIILNYIEGYARRKPAVQLNFLEIAYGSLRESKYLIYLSHEQKYINNEDYKNLHTIADEIGAILWTEIVALEKSLSS